MNEGIEKIKNKFSMIIVVFTYKLTFEIFMERSNKYICGLGP